MKAKEVMKKITLSLVAASMLLTAIPASAAEFSDGGEYDSSMEMDSNNTEQAPTEFSDGAGDEAEDPVQPGRTSRAGKSAGAGLF